MQPLPKVVFQHYRNPQNLGPLPGANACGSVEGRREDSRLHLRLRIEDGVVQEARFEVELDKSCTAGLSLLTSYLQGRPLPQVEALTLEELAAAYALHPEQHPMLVPVLEALEDALAAWRGDPSPFQDEGPLICHCLHVRRGRILRAVRQRGLRSVDEVRFWTRACSGCRSCRLDLEALLAES